jgi:hypothetical protein
VDEAEWGLLAEVGGPEPGPEPEAAAAVPPVAEDSTRAC